MNILVENDVIGINSCHSRVITQNYTGVQNRRFSNKESKCSMIQSRLRIQVTLI